MVIDIKMCRFENVPWGFRVVGGSDFEYPLTVVKVTEGSIAENAGLIVGDVIVRINDTAALPLTHDETNRIIKSCGNVFYFGIQRENEEQYTTPKAFPVAQTVESPKSFLEARAASVTSPVLIAEAIIDKSLTVDEAEFISQLEERSSSVMSEESERKFVEEEIAAVLSGESEVLKEHNKLGIFPKPGVCMSSDVLRSLNEEATKTKAEKDKENRKWTTFLQKPDRPIPKSKQQIEAERRAANAYKVKIVKGSSRSVSPAPTAKPIEKVEAPKEPTPPLVVEPEPEPEPQPETPTPIDTEVPNLEETGDNINDNNNDQEETEKSDKEKDSLPEQKETEEFDLDATDDNNQAPEADTEEIKAEVIEKTEEELALERQLADVQKQLAALSSLPSTIQTTLDSVTKQLADLLPTFKLQQEKPRRLSGSVAREINFSQQDKDQGNNENKEALANDNETEKCHELADSVSSNNTVSEPKEQQEQDNKVNEQITNDTNEGRVTIDKNLIKQQEVAVMNGGGINEETLQMEQEQNVKKQKKYDVIEELEEHLERKSNPKRSKRSFGPLTPASDRPLVLPGGRRWYRPKDAYNDEFIAETLSAQAELITGSTLGVNFMKYQKPEKKIDLNRSEVYKVIHHLDRQPVRGIEVRPSIVPAEVDVRTPLHSQ